MNAYYTFLISLFISVMPLTLAAGDECDCTISKKEDGTVHYSQACDSPKDICNLILGPDLGHIELLQFVDLREVDIQIGDGTYPSFLSSTLVSAGTFFAVDGTNVRIDLVAYGETVQRIEGFDQLKLLNDGFLGLTALICLSLEINIFGLVDGIDPRCTLGDQITFPVELLDWSAELQDDGVRLEWSTAQERDADYYRVMRSTDGKQFVEIARLTAAGLAEDLRQYATMDPAPAVGTNLYRLEQYDFDGTFHNLGIVTADWQSTNQGTISMWPNPAKPGEELSVSAPTSSASEARLIDPLGRCLARYRLQGQRTLNLPPSLTPGKYYIQIDGVASPLLVSN